MQVICQAMEQAELGGAVFDALQQQAEVGGTLPRVGKTTRLTGVQALANRSQLISKNRSW